MIQINLHAQKNAERKRRVAMISVILFAILAGSLSRAREPFIIDGEPVGSGDFSAIFAITMSVSGIPEDTGGGLCTAFLVAPRLLLTAAHCLKTATAITSLGNAGAVSEGRIDYSIDSYRANPGYFTTGESGSDELAGKAGKYDIGYLVLSQDLKKVTPLEVQTTDSEAALTALIGQTATFVGYGANQWESTGVYNGRTAGTKRKGTKTVSGIRNGLIYLDGEKYGVLPGDSGGPMILTIGGKTKVYAINHKKSDAMRPVEKKRRKKIEVVLVHDHYQSSIDSPLTTENLCWVEKNSGIEIPGVECPVEAAAP
jgi:hypothetical protein